MFWKLVAVTLLLFCAGSSAYAVNDEEILANYDSGDVHLAIEQAWEQVRATRQNPGPTSLLACEAIELLYDVLPSLLDIQSEDMI